MAYKTKVELRQNSLYRDWRKM